MGHKVIKNRLEVRCKCGQWGRMTGTDRFDTQQKQVVNFVCGCDDPIPNWEKPF